MIRIKHARTHNLRGVDLDIPHNQLTVITGVSGSGKSSLAIDTLYAEGQRQYIESLSTYARQFLNQLQRPEVEVIEGLQPTLCIDQKSGTNNPRSTVATITEVYDYLRLLMARVGKPSCPNCQTPIDQQNASRILNTLLALPTGTKLVVMAPVVRGRRGTHRDELNAIRKSGLVRVKVDGADYEIDEVPELETRKNHSIEAIVDRIIVRDGCEERLSDSIEVALRLAKGLVSVSFRHPSEQGGESEWHGRLFSTLYACPNCETSIEEIEPRTFSFNSPYGACSSCDGVGLQDRFSPDLLVSDWKLPANHDAFNWLKELSPSLQRKTKRLVSSVLEEHGLAWGQELKALKPNSRRALIEGNKQSPGLLAALAGFYAELDEADREQLAIIRQRLPCAACGGARLRPEALAVRLSGLNVFEICSMNLKDALAWFEALELEESESKIANPILEEMHHRLKFLNQVGVGYLTLARRADSLSGGELQRVRLASSIGSGLVGVSYILDEPSIGLHQRDNDRLIDSLRELQREGNTVIVVEHDEAMMRAADLLVDVGPGAGSEGGAIVAAGTPAQVEENKHSITAAFLRGDRRVNRTSELRSPNQSQWLRLKGAHLHNLKKVDLELPLGLLVGVTGVSGSGKSSLISQTLVPAILDAVGQAHRAPGAFKSLEGVEGVDKLIEITQTPIGRSPRSTPATYCGVFDLIRKVWAGTRDAKQRGYTSSRFSFNAGAGRCAQCQGQGQEKIEMQFLPDLYVRCAACNGARYNRQTLQVRYREKNIADVLEMSVREAASFFENFSKIAAFLDCLLRVGLGYLRLGQSSATLSGGEAQRIKLATELSKPDTGATIYFLDEPTTGLHFEDVQRLMNVLDGLVAKGNTVIVIEHNLDVIRNCDWLVDLGPDGGARGGEIVACGTPAAVAKNSASITGKYI